VVRAGFSAVLFLQATLARKERARKSLSKFESWMRITPSLNNAYVKALFRLSDNNPSYQGYWANK